MIRFYEEIEGCHIVIDSSFEQDDLKRFNALFKEKYFRWIVEFTNIYSLDVSIIQILYYEIFIEKKDIALRVHKERLSRYLYKLGFNTHSFVQQTKDFVNIENIKVILIGGSADSSEKIINIVKNCTFDNLSLVVVQHQQADTVAAFDKVLQPYTSHRVSYAKNFQTIKQGEIYLAPSSKHLLVENGYFILSDAPRYNFAKPSISISYDSFSNYYKKSLLAIQECGYVNDGVDKLATLKSNGSVILIQEKSECLGESDSMVTHALEEGVYDYIFTIQKIVEYINFLDKNYDDNEYIDYLLEQIKKIYEYDFRYYNHDMLQRRLDAFMIKNRIKSIKDGVGYILFDKEKLRLFLLELSINVTEFFRNPKMYKNLKEILITSYKKRENLKIWSAGCSSGEEAVSIAILLDTIQKLDKSIIYATDFNKIVIDEAKNGLYSLKAHKKAEENIQNSGLKPSMEHYFLNNNNFVSVQQFIIEKILYFEHNLVTDSSFNEFDIIICSNVLIYFEESLQKKIFGLFYNSLKFGGYLILGNKELMHRDYNFKFNRYNNETQIYKKVA